MRFEITNVDGSRQIVSEAYVNDHMDSETANIMRHMDRHEVVENVSSSHILRIIDSIRRLD